MKRRNAWRTGQQLSHDCPTSAPGRRRSCNRRAKPRSRIGACRQEKLRRIAIAGRAQVRSNHAGPAFCERVSRATLRDELWYRYDRPPLSGTTRSHSDGRILFDISMSMRWVGPPAGIVRSNASSHCGLMQIYTTLNLFLLIQPLGLLHGSSWLFTMSTTTCWPVFIKPPPSVLPVGVRRLRPANYAVSHGNVVRRGPSRLIDWIDARKKSLRKLRRCTTGEHRSARFQHPTSPEAAANFFRHAASLDRPHYDSCN
jgi:hypothetical protein